MSTFPKHYKLQQITFLMVSWILVFAARAAEQSSVQSTPSGPLVSVPAPSTQAMPTTTSPTTSEVTVQTTPTPAVTAQTPLMRTHVRSRSNPSTVVTPPQSSVTTSATVESSKSLTSDSSLSTLTQSSPVAGQALTSSQANHQNSQSRFNHRHSHSHKDGNSDFHHHRRGGHRHSSVVVVTPTPIFVGPETMVIERYSSDSYSDNNSTTTTTDIDYFYKLGHDWANDLRRDIVTWDQFIDFLRVNIVPATITNYDAFRNGFLPAYGIHGAEAFDNAFRLAQS
jgi:hypothetical protein